MAFAMNAVETSSNEWGETISATLRFAFSPEPHWRVAFATDGNCEAGTAVQAILQVSQGPRCS
jgi:hypothetical protein